ncbi:MAG: APC family permease [Streptosporangiaceae bacterium]
MASDQSAEPVGSFEASDRHLRKAMSFEHILFLCIGSIIGSGWLFASLGAMNDAGPSAIISWIVAGFFFIIIGLSFGEVGSMLPRSGGLVRYPQLTHGAYSGWILGWTYWVASVATPAIEAEAVVTYVGGKFPSTGFVYEAHGIPILGPPGIGFAVGLMLMFFFLNVFGIRLLAEWNRWFTWWKIFIPIVTFCFLFLVFKGSNFTLYGGFFPKGNGALFQTLSISGIAFAFLGFRQAVEYGGEGKRPGRDIPLATVLSVVITTLIYIGLQIGILGALDWGNAGITPGNWGGLLGSTWGTTPLYSAMIAAGIPSMLLFSNFLLVDAGVSPSGTGWLYFGTTARASYGLSIHGYGPRILQRHNRFGIPWFSVIVAGVVGCVFFVPSPSWYTLVGFITSTTVLTMIIGGMAVPVFRKTAPDLPRPYRLHMAYLLAPAAFLAAVEIFYWAGYSTLTSVEASIFVGLPLFTWYYAQRRGWIKPLYGSILGLVFLGAWVFIHRGGGWVFVAVPPSPSAWPFGVYDIAMSADVVFFCLGLWLLSSKECRLHIQRTAWLIWFLLAIFPASFYGQFGPLKSPPLPFPWMTLIVVGIGLVAYYWGAASGFQTDEIRDIIERHRGERGEEVAAPTG